MSHTVHQVYLVVHRATGKTYVGVTSMSLHKRLGFHRSYRNSALRNDLRKYGLEAFDVGVAYLVQDKEDALRLESELIRSLNTLSPNGYNRFVRGMTRPGLGGCPGNKNSRRTAIIQCTRAGNPMRRWHTVMDASKALGIHRNNIHRAINNPTYNAGGFKWKLA